MDDAPEPPGAAVTVAVATFRRNAQLASLLPLLHAQAAQLSPRAEILVVDNDPEGRAEAVVAGYLSRSPGQTRYVHEPRPGLATARNRALTEAASADALVFIDDDELPGEGWLVHLVAAWSRWRCSAVVGPVRAKFAEPPSNWVISSGAYARRTRWTGESITGGATNNLLLDMNHVRSQGLRFRERFGLTGGEDTMFMHELVHRGGVVRWCDEAEVVEPVAAERATRRWILRRAYRSGTTWSAMELELAGTPRRRLFARLSLTARSAGRLVLATALISTTVRPSRQDRRAPSTVDFVSCLGMLLGAYGMRHNEYRRDIVAAIDQSADRRSGGQNET